MPLLGTLIEREGENAIRLLIGDLINDGIISPDRHLIADSERASAV